jgi:catechol 2,3-dioxygenase-like lactoylglutathione lyase family enzyme
MPQYPFSHIDLSVTSFELALPFYEKILPALGFIHNYHSAKWKVFAADGTLPGAAYFAITEDPAHRANGNVIGFWGKDRWEVDRFAQLVAGRGGKIFDGPRGFSIRPSYYAFYFEDPCGNKFEFLHRIN